MDPDASPEGYLAISANMSRSDAHAWAKVQLDHVMREMQEAITRYVQNGQSHLRQLKAILNHTAPVHRIPDELLVDIFLRLKLDSGCFLKEWLKVAVVCKRWRETALNAPILWSTICCDDRNMGGELNTVPMCLQRSRQAPLSVYIHPYYADRAMRALDGHEWRVARLYIYSFSAERMLARFVDGFSRMTSIEVLDLAAEALQPISQQVPSADPTISLLAVQAHRLQRITIANLSLRTLNGLNDLKHLDVQSSNFRPRDWLSFIACCPRLEHLQLKHRIGSFGQPPEGPSFASVEDMARLGPRRVDSPALCTLKLELFLHHVAFFLERLAVPNAIHISLDAIRERTEPSAVSALMALRLMVTHDVHASSIQAIRVVLGEYFHISAWPTPDGSRKPLIRLTVPARQTAESVPGVLREVMRTFAPSSLAFLYLDTTWLHGVDAALWMELLCQYPQLVELRVAGTHSVTPALAALCTRRVDVAVCRRLAVLKLYSTSFPQTATAVLDVLRLRAAMGSKLKELHLLEIDYYESTVDDAIVERLKALVDVFNFTYDRGSLHG